MCGRVAQVSVLWSLRLVLQSARPLIYPPATSTSSFAIRSLLRATGPEPAWDYSERILSPLLGPLRHARTRARSLLVICALAGSASAATSAKVVAFAGNPSIHGATVSANEALQEHEKISVSLSNAQLMFNDGTKLAVGENSTLVVEKYLMAGGSTAQNLSVDALRGTFRFITRHSAKSAYRINAASSTIGIRVTVSISG